MPLSDFPYFPPTILAMGDAGEEMEEFLTRLYLVVLRHPAPSRSTLVAEGLEPDLVDAGAEVLVRRGLLDTSDERHWILPPPDIALPTYAATLEGRARQAGGAAAELAQVYFAARQDREEGSTDAVRMLTSQQDISAASADVMSRVHKRVAVMRADTPRTRTLLSTPHPPHLPAPRGADGREIHTIAVYDVKVLDMAGALDTLQQRHRAGEQVRLTKRVPFSALVADDSSAVIDVGNVEPSGTGSVLLRSRATVIGLCRLVEDYWDRGSALASDGETTPPGLDHRDLSVLALLAAGATDATIARQHGVSQRTIERRVRRLMDRLGVSTRFQAGVQAARQRLI